MRYVKRYDIFNTSTMEFILTLCDSDGCEIQPDEAEYLYNVILNIIYDSDEEMIDLYDNIRALLESRGWNFDVNEMIDFVENELCSFENEYS